VKFPVTASLVRRMRLSKDNMNQDQFAAELKASRSAVQGWERGKHRPKDETLRKMGQLAPSFSVQIEQVLQDYPWHPGKRVHNSRVSQETIHELHAALDIILNRAPSAVVEKVTATLTKFAGRFGDPPMKRGKKY
jgi:DNA-binding XRE family transcriptional regulator